MGKQLASDAAIDAGSDAAIDAGSEAAGAGHIASDDLRGKGRTVSLCTY
jgi:hypothetical protein